MHRAVLDLEMESGATLQHSASFDIRQVSRSGTITRLNVLTCSQRCPLTHHPTRTEDVVAADYSSDEVGAGSGVGDLYSTHSGLV
jgi:hypothetical protein